jgi:hypothetical protein
MSSIEFDSFAAPVRTVWILSYWIRSTSIFRLKLRTTNSVLALHDRILSFSLKTVKTLLYRAWIHTAVVFFFFSFWFFCGWGGVISFKKNEKNKIYTPLGKYLVTTNITIQLKIRTTFTKVITSLLAFLFHWKEKQKGHFNKKKLQLFGGTILFRQISLIKK